MDNPADSLIDRVPTEVSPPFGHDATALGSAFGRSELAEIVIPAVQRDDGLTGAFVQSIRKGVCG